MHSVTPTVTCCMASSGPSLKRRRRSDLSRGLRERLRRLDLLSLRSGDLLRDRLPIVSGYSAPGFRCTPAGTHRPVCGKANDIHTVTWRG